MSKFNLNSGLEFSKHTKIFNLLLAACIFLLPCCDDDDDNLCVRGSGSIVTETLTVPTFTGIQLSGSMDVIITQGAAQAVTAEGQANIIEDLRTNVSSSIWDIELREDCYNDFDLKIFITTPNINEISVAGSGNVSVDDFDNQGNLELKITGSGNIDLNSFDGCQNLDIEITGSGNVSGDHDFADLNNLDIEIVGSGNYSGFAIITNTCNVRILGSGDAEVHVNDNLDVTITGSGSVFYKGNPTIDSNVTGSGSLVNSN